VFCSSSASRNALVFLEMRLLLSEESSLVVRVGFYSTEFYAKQFGVLKVFI
jgi:hypothetical protein